MMRIILLGAYALMFAGCISVQPHVAKDRVSERGDQVNERNYTLGTERSATVGEPVVRLKAYTLTHRTRVSNVLTVNEQCRVRVGFMDHTYQPGEMLLIIGDTPCAEGTCRLVRVGAVAGAEIAARITPDGRLTGAPINPAFNNKMIGHIDVQPASCRFVEQEVKQQVAVHDGSVPYRNFEILYGGIEGQTLHFTYREYSFDDLARPAYAQPFSYPIDSHEIRFKDVVIDVAQAKPDSIRYTVIADGSAK